MDHITYEPSNQVAVLTIDSPPANALSNAILQELSAVLDEIENDTSKKAILLKGKGKFFSAGADISEFTSLQNQSDYTSLSQKGQALFNRIENFHIPLIAAIHGAALGGGLELAMACHIRIVTENAKLGLPEMSLGIIPGFAGTQRLPRYVGTAKAYEMILTSEPISGKEAFSYGLANTVTTEEELANESYGLAEKIAAKSGPTIHKVMQLIPYAKSNLFDSGVEAEAKAFGDVFGNQDADEGIHAFMEKRKPKFTDQ